MADRDRRHRRPGLDRDQRVELGIGPVVLPREDQQLGEQPAGLELLRLRLDLRCCGLNRLVQIARRQEFSSRGHLVASFPGF